MFDSVSDARGHFFSAFQKMQNNEPMEQIEKQLAEIIRMHPEYEKFLTDDKYRDYTFNPEVDPTNPFIHMSMHQAVREQLGTNRPEGIIDVFAELCLKVGDAHEAEHRVAEQLMSLMYEMMQGGKQYTDEQYLAKLRSML